MVLADPLIQVVHQVVRAKPTVLTNRNIDADAHEIQLDDFNIGLINQNDIFDLGVAQLLQQLRQESFWLLAGPILLVKIITVLLLLQVE